MSESSMMTIEFLRARLLSERAVSRAAKEMADQLAKRVVELEDQLRLVIAQRKMAEKETMEVLSILEAHGVDDPFEAIDLSSEGDEVRNFEKGGRETLKVDEVLKAPTTDMNQVEDANSSSEPGVSPLQAGSLSWRRHNTSPDSQRKLKDKQLRQWQRRLNLMSCESSPKYSLEKSCWKIKQNQMGLSTEDEGENDIPLADCADDQPDLSVEVSGSESCSLDAQNKEVDGNHYAIGSSARDEKMERLLEQQAQLIGQYEAEEKAQREWEEKYNDNASPNVDYSGLGNQCRIAENNFEQRKQSSEVLSIIPYEDEEKLRDGVHPSSNEQVTRSLSDEDSVAKLLSGKNQEMTNGNLATNGVMLSNSIEPIVSSRTSSGNDPLIPRDDLMGQVQTAKDSITDTGALTSVDKTNQNLLYENSDSRSNNDVSYYHRGHTKISLPSIGRALSSDSRRGTSKWGSWNKQDQQQMLVSQTASSSLGGVLEELQHAKISLRRELKKSHLSARSNLILGPPTGYCSRATVSDETSKVPVSSAGLFRLPTDAIEQAQISNHEIYTSRLSLPITYPDLGHATTTKYNEYPSTSYIEVESSDHFGERYSTNYSPGMVLSTSNRYIGYPDLPKGKTPLSYGYGDSGKQQFLSYTRGTGVPASTQYLPSDLTTQGKLLNGYGSSGNKQYSSNTHLKMGMSNLNRHLPPHTELPSDRTFAFDRMSKPDALLFDDGNSVPNRRLFGDAVSVPRVDTRNATPTADRYSLYDSNVLQGDKRLQ